jgi:hypothetical protein
MSSTYLQLPDGSAILTEVLPDGSLRKIRLPSPFVVDRGPGRNTAEDEAAIRAAEDRITELDRRER